jgi:putative phosphoesterase
MRIAVVSDTHDRLARIPWQKLGSADEIWHLGDVCQENILDEFRFAGPPLHVVRGNCDSVFNWPLARVLERGGLRFHLVHIPPDRVPDQVDCVLHGHTHRPRDEYEGDVRILNPGSAGLANKGAPLSMGWLEIHDRRMTWTIEQL